MSEGIAPLIVIDLQTGMFDGVVEPPLHGASMLADRARAAIDWARRTRRPVAFIRHDGPEGDPLAPGEPGSAVWRELGQAEREPTSGKTAADAFSNPALGRWLAEMGARSVVLLGAQSDYCVAATVRGACAAGLEVTVVSDAHSTWDSGGETAVEIIARQNAQFARDGVTLLTTAALTGE